jgi:hypothetical protein
MYLVSPSLYPLTVERTSWPHIQGTGEVRVDLFFQVCFWAGDNYRMSGEVQCMATNLGDDVLHMVSLFYPPDAISIFQP